MQLNRRPNLEVDGAYGSSFFCFFLQKFGDGGDAQVVRFFGAFHGIARQPSKTKF